MTSTASHGPLARVAYWASGHGRRVAVGWLVLIVGLGVFLPKLEGALSGAGMEHTGSESVHARELIQAANPLFASSALSVVMHGARPYGEDPQFRAAARAVAHELSADPAVRGVIGPTRSGLIAPDGRTVIVTGGAGRDTSGMVHAADRLRDRVRKVAGPRYKAQMSGLSAQWADFNKENRDALVRGEKYALPITLLVLVVAFGSLLAAGLPLLITVIGLFVTGGFLYLFTQIGYVSIWALSFMLIFTMALGIDYALFIVMRFREALREHADPVDAVAATMDTAGRAVAFSGTTVLVATAPCYLIPSPMPKSIAMAIELAVCLVLAVVFTLLPMLLARLGPRIDAGAMPWLKRRHAMDRDPGAGRMADSAPLVIGLILLLGFLLLLVAVQAPFIALAGTLTSLLSSAAAFGVTVLVFQDGHFTGPLGIHATGYIDFWAPVFFFAMIFAVAMDYTVFFISSAREQWDLTGDPRAAVVGGMGRSGPVILAAAAAMLGVYGTFAASSALPAKEMGMILGLAVLLDAFLVRLALLPALLRLAGTWAWWQPVWLGRVLPSFSLAHSGPAARARPGLDPAAPTPSDVADRREAILDAAQALFAERGYRSVTSHQIARCAGVDLDELERLFESRDEILATVLERLIDRAAKAERLARVKVVR
ncbi:MMPL family transporter [Paraconexibacter antarcticus]|uniref:MMPL family transporter n=1 Tax=Paraconexibacter antarcticus TaxID=2949664 RepID=A0ABY5DR62_9ACTN|nr:MMPL family transporter [Paraconexibacter antarcticus]UTI63940.1 MMPL family transporter [Paraconexibacter antarcticus]